MSCIRKMPRNFSRQYLISRVWLIAFRDCGFHGAQAVAAADQAATLFELTLPRI